MNDVALPWTRISTAFIAQQPENVRRHAALGIAFRWVRHQELRLKSALKPKEGK